MPTRHCENLELLFKLELSNELTNYSQVYIKCHRKERERANIEIKVCEQFRAASETLKCTRSHATFACSSLRPAYRVFFLDTFIEI